MQRFTTLLHREWLQHKLGWTVVVLAPMALAALVLLFAQVQINVNDAEARLRLSQIPAVGIVLATIIGTAALTMLAAWASAVIQAPGLARRDQQDRSIEFWLSLPVGHVPAVAAPLLSHLILFPAAAMLVGLVGGQLISLGLVGKLLGLSALTTVPWGTVIWVVVLLSLRVLLGLVLATLWLSPLILLVMAASAWLKRWGLPALLGSYALIGLVLDKLYGNTVVWDLSAALTGNAGRALIAAREGGGGDSGGLQFKAGDDPTAMLQAFPGWIANDAAQALAQLASPLLLGALLVSTACFALLVLRRQRGA